MRWEHASENLQSQIFFVSQPRCASLDDTDLIVQAFHEAERDFVLGFAVSGDSIPMSINHLGKFLVRFQALPSQACAPVLEESPCPCVTVVVPELIEDLFEQVGGVQVFVGRQQRLEGLPAPKGEILAVRQQRVFLPFDETAVTPTEPCVFTFSYRVQRLPQVAHSVKLVKQNRCLRRVCHGPVAKRSPHVHHRQANASAFLPAKPLVEHRHTCLGAILATKLDRAVSNQVAHYDAISAVFAYRDLADANGFGSLHAGFCKLCMPMRHFKFLDRMPIQAQLSGNTLDFCTAAAPSNLERKALGIKGVIGQKREMLALHVPTTLAQHASHFEVEINAAIGAGKTANQARTAVVATRVRATTDSTGVFFERRTRVMTRAFGSRKTPRIILGGGKPRNAYASHSSDFRLADFALQTS
jgi:hypothetical protein